jgi:hypothetical protein
MLFFVQTQRFWLESINIHERRLNNMQIDISPQPVVALIAGIAILIAPKLLNFIVAIYLIVFGVLGLIRM